MTGPATVLPDWETEKCNALAAALLFTTPPTDRALRGWCPELEACEELTMLSMYDPMSARCA